MPCSTELSISRAPVRVTAQRHEPCVPELPVAPKRPGNIEPVQVRQPEEPGITRRLDAVSV